MGRLREAIVRSSSEEIKKYNLVLPKDLFHEVQKLAKARHTTVIEMFRKFIKLGLIVIQLEDSPDASLIIREGDTERQVVFL
jgi:hypothetical protein